MNSSGSKGICYIETKNLDGETNLKHKQAHKETVGLCQSDQEAISNLSSGWQVECEPPNEFLYKFEGNMQGKTGAQIPLTCDQMLLRGSSLRNTEWVIGVTVFTGHESKIMKNSVSSKAKYSRLETETNKYILLLITLQLAFSAVAAIYTSIWQEINREKATYLELQKSQYNNLAVLILVKIGQWFLILM